MSPRNKENWKSVLGHKPVAARLEVLGDSKSRWGSFGTGILLQIFGVTLLVTVPMLFPQKLIPIMRYEISRCSRGGPRYRCRPSPPK